MRRPDPPEVGHARAGIDVDWLLGGGQVLVQRRVLAELHEAEGEHGGRPAPFASRPGGRATASRSAAAGGSATSAHGLLGGSGGSDAAGAAVACLAARFAVRRRGAHSPSRQQRQVGAAPWSTVAGCVSCLLPPQFTAVPGSQNGCVSLRLVLRFRLTGHGRTHG
eukprot:scaffold70945_cov46-Phaeocystis_antarctica.AAC.1